MGNNFPNHVAVVPNGHRRSQNSFSSLTQAYICGAYRALEVSEYACDVGVNHMTFFGLSCENLEKRPQGQIDALVKGALLFCDEIERRGWHLHPFGKLDELKDIRRYHQLYERLAPWRNKQIPKDKFVVHVAANYSGLPRHELRPFVKALHGLGFSDVLETREQQEANWRAYAEDHRYHRPFGQVLDEMQDQMLLDRMLSAHVPPVDLLIRTGGEHRTSGLLPHQIGYAELRFRDEMWPDYSREMFAEDLEWFSRQQRNFGA